MLAKILTWIMPLFHWFVDVAVFWYFSYSAIFEIIFGLQLYQRYEKSFLSLSSEAIDDVNKPRDMKKRFRQNIGWKVSLYSNWYWSHDRYFIFLPRRPIFINRFFIVLFLIFCTEFVSVLNLSSWPTKTSDYYLRLKMHSFVRNLLTFSSI